MPLRSEQSKQRELERIAHEIENCAECRKLAVGVAVPGEGSATARVMFIGEAPGKQEAATGRPFIGRSGQLLRRLIRESGFREQDVFITSALKYLPQHVTPKPHEIAHARAHLRDQIRCIQPKVLVVLGRVAARSVLDRDVDMITEHGQRETWEGHTVIIMYHPAAALYSRRLLPVLEQDFAALRKQK